MKKSLPFFMLLAIVISGCKPTTVNNRVNIKRLSAVKETNQAGKNNKKRMHKASALSVDQAIVLYDYESEFTLTILLDNPKGYAVDAVQLTAKDTDAKIMVDGIYKPIHFDNGSRIVNWSQEDPYEKEFYIQSTLFDNDNYIEVTDIKVNGAWQGTELDNNILKVKRITNDNFVFEQVYNTFHEYKFRLNTDDTISNLVVEGATKNDDGTYSVLEEGLVTWNCEYTVDGEKYQLADSRNIQFLKVVDTYNSYYLIDDYVVNENEKESSLASFKYTLSEFNGYYRFWFKIIKGADIDFDKIKVITKNRTYYFTKAVPPRTPGFDCDDFHINDAETGVKLEIGGFIYEYTYEEIMVPKGANYGDDSFFDLAE